VKSICEMEVGYNMEMFGGYSVMSGVWVYDRSWEGEGKGGK
jgi:hypothetical protein